MPNIYERHLAVRPDALSKKSEADSLDRNPTGRGQNGGKTSLHVDGQGIPSE